MKQAYWFCWSFGMSMCVLSWFFHDTRGAVYFVSGLLLLALSHFARGFDKALEKLLTKARGEP